MRSCTRQGFSRTYVTVDARGLLPHTFHPYLGLAPKAVYVSVTLSLAFRRFRLQTGRRYRLPPSCFQGCSDFPRRLHLRADAATIRPLLLPIEMSKDVSTIQQNTIHVNFKIFTPPSSAARSMHDSPSHLLLCYLHVAHGHSGPN